MADASSEERAGGGTEQFRRRIPESRTKLWILLNANRWAVAGTVLAGLFVVFVALGTLDPTPLRTTMATSDPVETLFQGLVTAVITGVTLVVTINQLVLSQELGPVGDQRDRMEGAMTFRRDIEEVLGRSVSPVDPAAFLRAIVEHTHSTAEAVEEAVPADASDEARRDVEAYVRSVTENAGAVSDRLDGAAFGSFDVLMAALNFGYSVKIYQARRLKDDYGDLGEGFESAVDDVVETLSLYGPAREHFKTLYFQWELINLSRAVLYAAVPALAVTVPMVLYVDDPATVVGATLGVDNLVWVVSAAATVALVPFALLLSYILRIATVAKRTLAIGPFVLRGGDDVEDDRQ